MENLETVEAVKPVVVTTDDLEIPAELVRNEVEVQTKEDVEGTPVVLN